MPTDRLCIICNARKPESQFEKRGEHIVPRSLGNRRYRTPFVCTECNNGLGGTVDIALKSAPGVMLACYDRGIGSGRTGGLAKPLSAMIPKSALIQDSALIPESAPVPPENPDVKGAILKIVYEAAHMRLGNNWLRDPAAAPIRGVLSAYVDRDRKKACGLMEAIALRNISIGIFYYGIGRSRSEHIKHAITVKSCLNALWLTPINILTQPATGNARPCVSMAAPESLIKTDNPALAIVFDIEGLAPGFVTISDSGWGIIAPELLAPKLK